MMTRRMRRLMPIIAAALATVFSWTAAAVPPAAASTNFQPISGAGSTWSYNAIHAWVTNVAQYGMEVNYAPVGSTSGRQQFGQGTVDFGASEIPYGVRDGNNYDPPPRRGYAYMPDTAGGTTFMYNLRIGGTRVTNLRLSGSVVAGIFTGVIKKWNDPRIARDNPDLRLPAITIIPVVRSDGSGATAELTQWMLATQRSYWLAYCRKVGRSPCTQTSSYPVLSGSAMIGQAGDLGVSGYVSQAQAAGAIGYVEYSYALQTGFPVAKVLNRAGYYTEPTAGHVAVSLLKAKINMNKGSALYLTQNLSAVYTDPDPRTYELSSYSYMILPTNLYSNAGLTTAKGYTLGKFGGYLLCQGQQQVDALGYSALPINLVEAGYAQLKKIPGAKVPTVTTTIIRQCHNPTFSTNGTNTLAQHDPYPRPCDKKGPVQCSTPTGGAGRGGSGGGGSGSGGSGGSGSGSGGSSPGGGGSGSPGGSGSAAPGSSGTSPQACQADLGNCTGSTSGSQSAAPGQTINAQPVSTSVSLGDGLQVTLMALGAALLLGLALTPPLIAQSARRRKPPGGNEGAR
jgi:phosphate ABC transporter phosphate-binding protein